MIDQEKVIKGLELLHGRLLDAAKLDAIAMLDASTVENAIDLLKVHKPVKPKSKVRHGANAQIQHFCGNCNTMLHGKPKYCSECGKGVLWQKS